MIIGVGLGLIGAYGIYKLYKRKEDKDWHKTKWVGTTKVHKCMKNKKFLLECGHEYKQCTCPNKEYMLTKLIRPDIYEEIYTKEHLEKIWEIMDKESKQCLGPKEQWMKKEGTPIYNMLIEEAKKLDSYSKTEYIKSHPTSTYCDVCKAPRSSLICEVCGALLTPNFWNEVPGAYEHYDKLEMMKKDVRY